MNNNIVAVYPGSFDPPTKGHLDIISRASKIFPKVIVAITENYNKHHMFNLQERVDMMKESVSNIKNVEVDSFSGLLADYLVKIESFFVIRGLRALSDFEYEFQMALMNRTLNQKIETIFLMPDQIYTFLSSSMIKEIAGLGGDFKNLVPEPVYKRFKIKNNL
ncbi:MAG: pantetheine-phosphate adenylyltransferase [Endomicrobiia bacterium]|nr:pantetheine-phosphate adenylyltransferase [Endomicrobiaceae bacterium]MDD3052845.1 pantetheine-phosphate adenylyltransferase [Endomicrobiaceae bacterium]MDD3922872.1 pantetheine-phosphate adenylyltransferase [Endomicrobiaceae bacterium]MDD5101886.1 pantetheine-phosphate adenylyltransferase [Endomicrobiaceae bacterium]